MIVLLLRHASSLVSGGARTNTAKTLPSPSATQSSRNSVPSRPEIVTLLKTQPPGINAAMSDQTPKIRIRGLHKRFGTKRVLDGVNLDVPRGTSLVVIGGSGSGKSVLLKCVLGLIEPDDGSIEIDGHDILKQSPPGA